MKFKDLAIADRFSLVGDDPWYSRVYTKTSDTEAKRWEIGDTEEYGCWWYYPFSPEVEVYKEQSEKVKDEW